MDSAGHSALHAAVALACAAESEYLHENEKESRLKASLGVAEVILNAASAAIVNQPMNNPLRETALHTAAHFNAPETGMCFGFSLRRFECLRCVLVVRIHT